MSNSQQLSTPEIPASGNANKAKMPLSTRALIYVELTKPRLSILALATVAAGYVMGSTSGQLDLNTLWITLVSLGLVAGGVAALNQYLERERDARMNRTKNRPLPSGRMAPKEVLIFGTVCSIAGVTGLFLFVNLLSALLGFAVVFTYLFIYVPLKPRTTLNTLVGAVPGALPAVVGWTAAANEVTIGAIVIFMILFFWQLPHFWSIAWLYREDYRAGGMKMLSALSDDGGMMARQVFIWSIPLLVASMLPTLVRMTGPLYAYCTIPMSIAFTLYGFILMFKHTRPVVRGYFFASIAYIPLLFAFMLLDRTH